ncbi:MULTISPECIES: ABC transporter ATP-binding protein [Paraburkholderia]|uniref:ABC transporter ATP-binding protein n=2 Tax=Pseudomonadota TaxID=1224 RepID=A0A9Q6WNU5_9BURK|nr:MULTISPECIES: ABC transporter ATP-binding protein [Paraburkholderia]ALP65100.1 peptide ABC transporter ATP-binding protein [Paraburkholderia caribensis]AMV44481.1 peptide ABC transporter ATP-binding protein [Paraburkholderia caribensis]AUT53752.1 ABC transporter ATP-binding protein [Paraburkholderia caribensis]MCO4883155.1 ABC transporter ATP-binding protein [Paraburkholderia caribensis]PTB27964.1 ABC transporter ATP-binding protein [Paraburkholderia caribensis]
MSTHDTTRALCEIDDLRIAFRAHDGTMNEAVRGLSLTLNKGERLGIVGESGSGKSLTGRALLGLLPPAAHCTAKTMRFDGSDLLDMRADQRRKLCGQQMGMILQDPKYSLNPVMTVAQQMREAFALHEPKLGRRAMREKIIAALEAVHIRNPERVVDSYPHELSGGMGQRVMIAMMVSTGPRLLIADEPTSALDVLVSMQVLAVLDEMIAKHDTGLIFISHDLPLVMSFCDRVVVMYAGRVVETCAARDLVHAQHPYTRGLLAANPPLANPPDELPVLSRDPAWLNDVQGASA